MTLHEFVTLYAREHARTRTQLHAFPAAQAQLKPHDRSSSALVLAWTFVVEEMLMLKALRNEPVLGVAVPTAPATWAEVLEAFDTIHPKVLAAAGATSDAALKPVVFPVGPGKIGDYPPVDFLWFMLSDQIHHRGQLTVYTRIAGGKVPSVYGPSADEPWT